MDYKAISFLCLLLSAQVYATTWNVGPARTYTFCSQVAPLVQHGDTVLIDFATYFNDPQVIWNKSNLYIAGTGGRPRLEAGSIIAGDMVNGKGIFVISGSNVHIHNIEFANAVVQDNNGAGIRQEGANLWVSNCAFTGNEMGILGGNIPDCKTTIEYCEFFNGGSLFNPGYQHNIYINHIDTLLFRYNYSHDAIAEGHELKSRASYNFILYNRIANEGSIDSRTIDLPNGGTTVLVGNVIEQGANSANSNILGYGLEGLTNNAPHRLFCCNNTFINKKTTGSFIQVADGMDTLFVKNNIFAGTQTGGQPGGFLIGTPAVLEAESNASDNDLAVFRFVDPANYDYHLLPASFVVDHGVDLSDIVLGYPLKPTREYKDTCGFESRNTSGAIDLGAYEFVLPLGTVENNLPEVNIFPNPASETIYVDFGNKSTTGAVFRLLNVYGVVCISQYLSLANHQIDISGLNAGIYFAVIIVDNTPLLRKITIQ